MIATLVAFLLLAALALLAGIALALQSMLGWPVGATLAAAFVVVACVLPFAFVSLACALALRWRAAASPRLGVRGFLQLAGGETAAFARTYLYGQLRQRSLAPCDPADIAPGVIPVLLVHGIYCNAGVWHRLVAYLRSEGTRNVFCVNLGPPLSGIDRFARQLAQRVDEVCEACKTTRVIVVAHSMGGLVARAWRARLGGDARAARVVTIATPHRGSRLARFAPGRCAAEMVPGSPWLVRLHAEEAGKPAARATCIASWHDSLVAPQDSALVPEAAHLTFERLGHLQLLVDARVHARVAAEVASARSGSPS